MKLARLEYETQIVLAQAYLDLGDADNAAEASLAAIEMRDAVMGLEVQREIGVIESRAELERLRRDHRDLLHHAHGLQRELERRSEELTAMALRLLQRNEMIAKLAARVEQLQSLVKEDGPRPPLLTSKAGADETWEDFSRRFHAQHHDFHATLLKRFPSLSPAELKVCALIRAGLSSKEISTLLYISGRTVEVHRGRIRRKLGVGPGASLSNFIAGL
jgi:ATP/maltotriose-dependent transcriptional regulator MalT